MKSVLMVMLAVLASNAHADLVKDKNQAQLVMREAGKAEEVAAKRLYKDELYDRYTPNYRTIYSKFSQCSYMIQFLNDERTMAAVNISVLTKDEDGKSVSAFVGGVALPGHGLKLNAGNTVCVYEDGEFFPVAKQGDDLTR